LEAACSVGQYPRQESNKESKSAEKLTSRKVSAAESGAVLTQTAFSDQRLRELVAAWPRLPEPVRAGIIAMVKASAAPDKG